MASAFWTLEDGRGFARRWTGMASMLEMITDELKEMKGAKDFYVYLEAFVFREERGDIPNGYGGFIKGDENIMFNFDLRSFAPQNREYFWQAAQNALTKWIVQGKDLKIGQGYLFTILLDMHKRIGSGEDPRLLNDMGITEVPKEKLGPGW